MHTLAQFRTVRHCAGGYGDSGRLGSGNESNTSRPRGVVGLNDGVTAISAGNTHGCAIHNGAAKCWGFNGSGEIGDGTQTRRLSPVSVIGLETSVTAIAAGGHHSCAVVDATAARCWGRGSEGQLGDGTNMRYVRSQ